VPNGTFSVPSSIARPFLFEYKKNPEGGTLGKSVVIINNDALQQLLLLIV
jgi:hypothetical protein